MSKATKSKYFVLRYWFKGKYNPYTLGAYGGEMSHYIEVKDSDYNVLRDVVRFLKKSKS